jgi:glycosyltransferase involved in cell wall biosynthesis
MDNQSAKNMKKEKRRLVLIGTGVIHTFKYLHLIEENFEEVLVITDRPAEGINHAQFTFDFSMRSPLHLLKKIKTLRREIERFNPDIVHVHQANSCAWFTIKACGNKYPLIVTAWGSDILATPQKGFLYRKLIRYVMTHARFFTSDAIYMADVMRKYAGRHRPEILIANFGIDITPGHYQKEQLVYSNRQLTPLYRIHQVIEVFHTLIHSGKQYADWKLAIAATGSEEEQLKAKVRELGLENHVTFYGWVGREQNTLLYQKASIFISIPESDATSISLLEAMACGCIPVVSDLPANREWIRDNVNGCIMKPNENDVLLRALSLNMQKVQEMNAGIIEKEGTKEANKARFMDFYEKVIDAR